MLELKKVSEAIRNPPPERLAKIEYQSHALGILGNLFVCIALIYNGYWYIIFAFIFSVGVSYSQMVQAKQKYNLFMQFKQSNDAINDIIIEKSPTRKKDKMIRLIIGKHTGKALMLSLSLITFYLVYYFSIKWYLQIPMIIGLLVAYLLIYFFIIGYIAERRFKRKYNVA